MQFSSTKTKAVPRKTKKRLSTLYDARSTMLSEQIDSSKLNVLIESISDENPSIPFLSVIRKDNLNQPTIATTYGPVPVGSVLSNQCPLVCSGFSVIAM